MSVVTYNAEVMQHAGMWCLDSGARKDMCNKKGKFSVLNEEIQTNVYTAAEHHVKSKGTGEIKLDVKLGRNTENSIN
jgi:hypothetical protein